MSGSNRGEQLFKLMRDGQAVCSILVGQLLVETLIDKKDEKVSISFHSTIIDKKVQR